MASILYYSGADPVSISKRLGHAQVSTTQDMYSHLVRQADTQSAERIADAIFRDNQSKNNA
jgi:integrase